MRHVDHNSIYAITKSGFFKKIFHKIYFLDTFLTKHTIFLIAYGENCTAKPSRSSIS